MTFLEYPNRGGAGRCQGQERHSHAAAEPFVPEQHEVGAKKSHGGNHHSAEDHPGLVLPHVGAGMRVEPVEEKHQRENGGQQAEIMRVVLQEARDHFVGHGAVPLAGLINHRYGQSGDHAQMHDREIRGHAGQRLAPLPAMNGSQH